MVSSRAYGATHLPEWVAVSGVGGWLQVHESWWVQDNPGTFRICSTVLCIQFLLFDGERKRKKKEEKKTTKKEETTF
jgi:hypothetical protein